jgi:hypothetical protein
MKVSWTAAGGTTAGYKLAVAEGKKAPDCSTGASTGNVTSYEVTGLKAKTSYMVSLCSKDANGGLSSAVTASSATTVAPPTPKKLKIASASSTSLQLSWTASKGSTTGYKVAVAEGTTVPSCSAGVSLGKVTSYTADKLKVGTMYTVALCSIDSNGALSAPTQTVSGSTVGLPAAPSGLKISKATQNSLKLTWTRGPKTVVGYQIAMAAGSTAPSCSSSSGKSYKATASFTQKSLTAKTTYTFSICAKNAGGDLSPQATISGTTTNSKK